MFKEKYLKYLEAYLYVEIGGQTIHKYQLEDVGLLEANYEAMEDVILQPELEISLNYVIVSKPLLKDYILWFYGNS